MNTRLMLAWTGCTVSQATVVVYAAMVGSGVGVGIAVLLTLLYAYFAYDAYRAGP